MEEKSFKLDCVNLGKNAADNHLEHGAFWMHLTHCTGDPTSVNRLMLGNGSLKLELLPSKGLSVGEAYYDGKPLFWKPPLKNLPDPDRFDLHGDTWISGDPVPGFRWVEGFTGGVELLGLKNWGMPVEDETGRLLPIHGFVSLIPVPDVRVTFTDTQVNVSGAFEVYDEQGREGEVWYRRGQLVYEVTRTVILKAGSPSILLRDTIANRTDHRLTPDWGYHVQLRPVDGARYLVPARSREGRSGEPLPPEHEVWHSAKNPRSREEKGIIHYGLQAQAGLLDGRPGVKTLLRYPDGSGIQVVLPLSPFFLSWFSCGGQGDTTICLTASDGSLNSLFQEAWDGVGPEIGASALDHDGRTDPDVQAVSLAPGETLQLSLLFEPLSPEAAAIVEREIEVLEK